ncbi:MAG: molybdate ABC transporter substrate-binding protein [Alphaproteobacteria bacterium]|nr:molybdate ABC transporter substrate-binding protein [Alphaproteobacteria bacterium]MBU1551965.1 molybdate ABC transporter substrate-binding protein [Alphaproteobacteria bacterium]MBU2335393.1 molybdate ABC transporter substrate-binding protein [Alphaproteobacteria bacterium]MBU2391423.1 molybdate ABC transporter substrate-binding protein [Alphaproteobacteria bacterium]
MSWIDRSRRGIMGLAASLALLACLPETVVAQQPVTVFAAASMKNALDAASTAWTEKSGIATSISYAGSSALARQIEAGAPADLFISADLQWMDYLAAQDLIDTASRTSLLGNRIVLIGARGAPAVDIGPGFDLAALIGDGKLAMAAPDSVPAGRYGKAALESLGVWPSVAAKVAGAENVRAALQYVARGEAPYGIVYRTDAAADPNVTVVGIFPETSHPPIVYPVAPLRDADNPAAADYLEFLKSEEARPFFEAEGFAVLHGDR